MPVPLPLREADHAALQRLYHRTFDNDDGRLVLADLEQRCYVQQPSFDPNPTVAAFREGMRAALLHILTMLQPIEPANQEPLATSAPARPDTQEGV